MILIRLHPIEEAIRTRPRQIEWILVDSQRGDRRINELKRACREQGILLRYGDRQALERASGSSSHQGAVARIAAHAYRSAEAALEGRQGDRFLLLLDQVQDPQNLGAVLRVAEAVGATVVLPERGSAPLSEAVARSSAGAIERVPVTRVPNFRRFMELAKAEGFRIVGLDPTGSDL